MYEVIWYVWNVLILMVKSFPWNSAFCYQLVRKRSSAIDCKMSNTCLASGGIWELKSKYRVPKWQPISWSPSTNSYSMFLRDWWVEAKGLVSQIITQFTLLIVMLWNNKDFKTGIFQWSIQTIFVFRNKHEFVTS